MSDCTLSELDDFEASARPGLRSWPDSHPCAVCGDRIGPRAGKPGSRYRHLQCRPDMPREHEPICAACHEVQSAWFAERQDGMFPCGLHPTSNQGFEVHGRVCFGSVCPFCGMAVEGAWYWHDYFTCRNRIRRSAAPSPLGHELRRDYWQAKAAAAA